DGDNLQAAQRAMAEFKRALRLYPPKENGWSPQVTLCSSTQGTGIDEIWGMVEDFVAKNRANGFFGSNRGNQNRQWFQQSVDDHIKRAYRQNPSFLKRQRELLVEVERGSISPFYAAKILMEGFGGHFN